MIRTDKIIVVEGKYDRIKLSSVVDATVIQTDGFGIFKNKELSSLLRKLAKERGLIILTDSDRAGFAIRNHVINLVGGENVINVYIPDVEGKEKRKAHPSKEGTLGVEGMSEKILLEAFQKAGVTAEKTESTKYLTKTDLYFLGLSGGENSSLLRDKIKKELKLPARLSTNRLMELLNILLDKDGFEALLEKIGVNQ